MLSDLLDNQEYSYKGLHCCRILRNMAYEAAEYDRQAEVIRKQVRKYWK